MGVDERRSLLPPRWWFHRVEITPIRHGPRTLRNGFRYRRSDRILDR